MGGISVTKKEMLLAIAMSEFYSKSLVFFITAGKEYTTMLRRMREKKYVEPVSEANSHFKLSKKGREYILRQDINEFKTQDMMVDKFIDNL